MQESPVPHADTLTPREVAEALSMSRRQIYRWIRSGKLPTTKIDGRHAISAEQLAEAEGVVKATDAFIRCGKRPQFLDARRQLWVNSRQLSQVLKEVRASLAPVLAKSAGFGVLPEGLRETMAEIASVFGRGPSTEEPRAWPDWATRTRRAEALFACWTVLEDPTMNPATQKEMFEAAAPLLGDTWRALDRRLRRAIASGLVTIRGSNGSLNHPKEWPGPDLDDWHRFLQGWVRTRRPDR